MNNEFMRTNVGGVSLPRLIIGSNWVMGYSHKSPAADCLIKEKNKDAKTIAVMLEVFLNAGINSMMAIFGGNDLLCDAIKIAEDRTGKGMILVDTPIINMDNTAAARKEAEETISLSRKAGSKFCLIHHSSTEQLINKNTKTMDRLPDYLSMIRDNGMIPGLSAHMPEVIVYSDLNEYDVQTYIQLYNCMGFLMQVEVEYIHKVIWAAKKPVMTIKPMAAGRVSPFVGLTFSWHTIRPCDMVTVGCLTPQEAAEDIEISRAALESRPPELEALESQKDITK